MSTLAPPAAMNLPLPDLGTGNLLRYPARRPPLSPRSADPEPERPIRSSPTMVGQTPAMKRIFETIRKVSTTMSTVLVTGESGTGKELVARTIHFDSPLTRERRFVAVNCAAIPDLLLESELFGHRRGAFTGAETEKAGLFEAAQGGTILLDEIGEMSVSLQAKLLRVLEEGEIRRVGAVDPLPIQIRIICSTNRNLPERVRQGSFREDLFYRINVVGIHIPPLRERREDIPDLVRHLVPKLNRKLHRNFRGVEPEALQTLLTRDMKGNVRELENLLERAMILGEGEWIGLRDLFPEEPAAEEGGLYPALQALECVLLQEALRKAGGNKKKAARNLKISMASLYRKLTKRGSARAKE